MLLFKGVDDLRTTSHLDRYLDTQRRTRVYSHRRPVSAMLENLEASVSLDEFIENFPTVDPTVERLQAVSLLEHLRHYSVDLVVP